MPSHEVHSLISKALFGKSYREVDRAIDRPYKFLGRKHRKLFHDPISASVISYARCRSPFPGLLHIYLDEICSRDAKLRKMLEAYAKLRKLVSKDR